MYNKHYRIITRKRYGFSDKYAETRQNKEAEDNKQTNKSDRQAMHCLTFNFSYTVRIPFLNLHRRVEKEEETHSYLEQIDEPLEIR